jgi:hypothetical protein
MRISQKAFLSCIVVAGIGLLAASGVRATGYSTSNIPTPAPSPLQPSCSVPGTAGGYTITVSDGPSFVSCSSPSGQCTEIEYEVSGGTPEHVAAVQGIGIQYVIAPSGNQWYPPCVGDPVTGLGKNSCHEQAAKFNPTSSVKKFRIGLDGQRKPGPTTVATKKGSKIGACRIQGIGLEGVASPFQSTAAADCQNFKGCVVCFSKDPATGEVVDAYLDLDLSPKLGCNEVGAIEGDCCSDLIKKNASQLAFFLDDVPLGSVQVGDGYASSGTASCTTRFIGGKVYTWGSPCP